MNKLCERIKELREELEVSQFQLSKIIKVSQSTIARWETGTRTPSVEMIVVLAQFFGVTSDYLIGLED